MRKKGQVWIETVIYTLIGLTVIGLVLTFATPKIEAIRDKAVIEQTITALSEIDAKIAEMSVAIGNVRTMSLSLKKGELTFDCLNDRIEFLLEDSRYIYSQPGQNVSVMRLNLGSLSALTEEGRQTKVRLWIDYKNNIDLSCKGEEGSIVIKEASLPYEIVLNNKDIVNGLNVIDLEVS